MHDGLQGLAIAAGFFSVQLFHFGPHIVLLLLFSHIAQLEPTKPKKWECQITENHTFRILFNMDILLFTCSQFALLLSSERRAVKKSSSSSSNAQRGRRTVRHSTIIIASATATSLNTKFSRSLNWLTLNFKFLSGCIWCYCSLLCSALTIRFSH